VKVLLGLYVWISSGKELVDKKGQRQNAYKCNEYIYI